MSLVVGSDKNRFKAIYHRSINMYVCIVASHPTNCINIWMNRNGYVVVEYFQIGLLVASIHTNTPCVEDPSIDWIYSMAAFYDSSDTSDYEKVERFMSGVAAADRSKRYDYIYNRAGGLEQVQVHHNNTVTYVQGLRGRPSFADIDMHVNLIESSR